VKIDLLDLAMENLGAALVLYLYCESKVRDSVPWQEMTGALYLVEGLSTRPSTSLRLPHLDEQYPVCLSATWNELDERMVLVIDIAHMTIPSQ